MRIKAGWEGAGMLVIKVGEPIVVNGMSWTPVVEEPEEDPSFFKTAGLEEA